MVNKTELNLQYRVFNKFNPEKYPIGIQPLIESLSWEEIFDFQYELYNYAPDHEIFGEYIHSEFIDNITNDGEIILLTLCDQKDLGKYLTELREDFLKYVEDRKIDLGQKSIYDQEFISYIHEVIRKYILKWRENIYTEYLDS